MIRILDIQREVAAAYGIPVTVMGDPAPTTHCGRNPLTVSRARQTSMALSFLLTEHGKTRIGHYHGGRDHTTVLHACRAVERRRRSDAKLRTIMRRVTFDLLHRNISTPFATPSVADRPAAGA